MDNYVISLDAVDLDLLPIYNSGGIVSPLMRGRPSNEREYCEFRIMETQRGYKDMELECVMCHICNIEVPRIFTNEHFGSIKHKANANIARVAAERITKFLHNNIARDDNGTVPIHFCPNCVICMDPKDRENHEKTLVHKNSVTSDKFLNELYVLYASEDETSDAASGCVASVELSNNNITTTTTTVTTATTAATTTATTTAIATTTATTTNKEKEISVSLNTDDNQSNTPAVDESNDGGVKIDDTEKKRHSPKINNSETRSKPVLKQINAEVNYYNDLHFNVVDKKVIFCNICNVNVPNKKKNIIMHERGNNHRRNLM